eukprot:scaffold92534_cov69-Phaeocystis_antarctica.AAC.6
MSSHASLPMMCTPTMRPEARSNTSLSSPCGAKTRPRRHAVYGATPSRVSMSFFAAACWVSP